MNFDQWRNDEELDLIVVFLTGKNGDDHIRVVAEDRIQLTSVSTFATPTPPEFIEEDPTPTPTPFTIHDLSSWMVFDPVKLIIHDDKIEKLSLKNVTIDNLNMPEFLGRESMFEVISFAIVKKDYDGSHASAYDASSDMVYGNSSNFIKEESNELIGTFEQFYQLESGNIGNIKITEFEENQLIVKGSYESNFMEWKGTDDLDLLVMFGSYDFETGENKFHLQDRFPIDVDTTFTETPTPEPLPTPESDGPNTGIDESTPTPVSMGGDVSAWLQRDSATLNVENNEIKDVLLKNVLVTHENKPEFLTQMYDYEIVAWTIVNENFHDPLEQNINPIQWMYLQLHQIVNQQVPINHIHHFLIFMT